MFIFNSMYINYYSCQWYRAWQPSCLLKDSFLETTSEKYNGEAMGWRSPVMYFIQNWSGMNAGQVIWILCIFI